MSLKVRLIALVAGALLISLAATLLLIGLSASRWVQAEIDTDARMAGQLVQARIAEEAEESESPNRIADLLRALETTHHLHARFISDDAAPDEDALPQTAISAPSWLGPLLGVRPTVQKLPVIRDGETQGWIVITTDPGTGIAKVWRMVEIGLAAIALFSILALALVAFGLTQGLRPLGRLASGLARIGSGDYTLRVGSEGPAEIALLGRHFDLMADRLQSMQTRTRALTAQLLAVQERERRDIARDLHDDLGPCLLAANLDVLALARLNQAQAETSARDGVEECARGLRDALGRMQGQVRGMISRLHLESGDTFDLGAATADLAGFWRERCPEITWHVAPWDRWPELPPAQAVPLQRILQEAVSNAVRHGGARNIYIDCSREAGATVVQVRDDGVGIPEQVPAGFGIPGMRERIEALGGSLTIDSRRGQGTTVAARLPAVEADTNTSKDDIVPDRAVA